MKAMFRFNVDAGNQRMLDKREVGILGMMGFQFSHVHTTGGEYVGKCGAHHTKRVYCVDKVRTAREFLECITVLQVAFPNCYIFGDLTLMPEVEVLEDSTPESQVRYLFDVGHVLKEWRGVECNRTHVSVSAYGEGCAGMELIGFKRCGDSWGIERSFQPRKRENMLKFVEMIHKYLDSSHVEHRVTFANELSIEHSALRKLLEVRDEVLRKAEYEDQN